MGTNIGPIFEEPPDAGPRPGAPKGGDATKIPKLITWISKNPHLPGEPDPDPNETYHKTLVWLVPGRAIKGSIDEDKDGKLSYNGEFSTSKHPNGTRSLDKDEEDELKALLNREKPDVDNLDQKRYKKTREDVRRALERAKRQAQHKRQGTCEVTISGPDTLAKGQFGKYTADGLPAGGSYSWSPTVQEDLGGLYGVQQAKGETTMRADDDNGTAGVGVVYRVGSCEARDSKLVRLIR